MKVPMIHALTGSLMYVEESKVNQYKAAGHKPAAEAHPEAKQETPAEKPKRTRKKTATQK